MAEPVWLGALASPMQRRAQQGHLREIVEMAGLQGGVLAVVGEAQELPRFGAEIPVTLQLDERAEGEDRGGGASVVHPQRCQLEAFGSLASRVGDATGGFQAEQEIAANEGTRRPLALRHDPPHGVCEDRLRNVLAGVAADPLRALFVGLLEGVRQAVEQLGTVGTRPGVFFGEMEVPVFAAIAVGVAAVLAGKQHRASVLFEDPHAVVLGSATAAEDERVERLVQLARCGRLLRELQVATRSGFERRPDGVAAGEELMEPEREDGEATGLGAMQIGALEQPCSEYLGASIGIAARELRKLRGGASPGFGRVAGQPARHLSEEPARAGFFTHAEGRLDPGREGMTTELVVVVGGRFARGDGVADAVSYPRGFDVDLGRRAFEGLADDLLRREGHAEQRLRHLRHFEILLLAAPAARHGGGGAHAEEFVPEGVATAANEHRDVGALAPAIGMQLVEDEELEPLGGSHQRAILASREEKLQHHVVREQNIGRVGPNGLARVVPLLPRIAGEAHRGFAFRVALVDELPELLGLAVGEGVHGVDDDGLDAAAGPAPEDAVHDRHDVGEALSGAGTGRQYVGAAFLRLEDRVALVPVQEELPAAMIVFGLADPEYPRALGMENPLLDQIVDRSPGPERRVELEERLRPKSFGVKDVVDELVDPRVADLDEAPGVLPVVGDEAFSEVEDVHPGRSRHAGTDVWRRLALANNGKEAAATLAYGRQGALPRGCGRSAQVSFLRDVCPMYQFPRPSDPLTTLY